MADGMVDGEWMANPSTIAISHQPSAMARALVAAAAAALMSCGGGGGARAELRAIPGQNVLLVTIDTLRADALGAYGGAAAPPALGPAFSAWGWARWCC